jgi:hypothetical protein
MSTGAISDSLASSIAFSGVPPMPMPRMPGGHQPAPMVGTVFSTQSTMESEGLSITNFDLFSEPPPLAATDDFDVVAGDHLVRGSRPACCPSCSCALAGRVGSTEARSLLSGCSCRRGARPR